MVNEPPATELLEVVAAALWLPLQGRGAYVTEVS